MGGWNRVGGTLATAAGLLMAYLAPAGAQTKVVVALPINSAAMAPMFYALDAGIFKRNGLDVELPILRGGPPTSAALLSGDAQFMTGAGYDFLRLVDSGKVARVLNFVSALTNEFVVSEKFIKARGIDLKASPKQRLASLKGLRLGAVSLGGASESFGRWLLKFGGLDPDKEPQPLQIGGLPQLLGAMQADGIDGFVISPPSGKMAARLGIGRTLVDYKEIPELDGYQFIGLDARPDWIAANPATAEKVVRSVVEAQQAIVDRPIEVARRLKAGSMNQNDLQEIEDALTHMAQSYKPQPMSAQKWAHTQELTRQSVGDGPMSSFKLVEDRDWTNKFYNAVTK